MKKLLTVIFAFCAITATAQYRGQGVKDVRPHGFQKDKLFTGGSLNLGFSSYSTNIGVAPQFGYSLTDWLDAGVSLNVNYISERDPYSPDKIRQTTIGPGAFVRLFPFNFLFASAQYEYNFITQKYLAGNPSANQKLSYEAPSLLLGLGYAGGRVKGSNTYYYFSISADFLGNEKSPYIDSYERMVPVIRAGYNIGLFQGQRRRR